ncbi:MAG: mandelate racemase/muconate lactonizing enzyme family protein [Comamonas sp.]
MKITYVKAYPLNVPLVYERSTVKRETSLSACYVEIGTDNGILGHGFTAITEEEIIAYIINDVLAAHLVGKDPSMIEALWDQMYWLLAPRGQTGYAMHAISAIDVALWDIKGKALGQPVWKLLGGAREQVPVYTTFGFGFLSIEDLALAAQDCVKEGFQHLKMVVGHSAMHRRDEPRPLLDVIREDARRVRAVRDAVGSAASLYIDANCSLDAFHAAKLVEMIADCDIAFFEEPITQNDARCLADLRARSSIALAAGQNEGLAYRFRDLLLHQAVDFLQPNVVISGGYTQARKVAGMAEAFNIGIANGGAFPLHNMHLHAGLLNGGKVEWHLVAVEMMNQLYTGMPSPVQGWLQLPQTPGLGFEPNRKNIEKLSKIPASKGRGKG